MTRRRWIPKKKRQHEDGISEWQPGGGDKQDQITDKQLKKSKAPPDNLGTRHLALNTRVNNALADNINFNDAKDAAEATELDRLFKIDLAAKLKNVDFIIDTLKTGDSLYTARALKKCEWLFEDEHSDIINPEYLFKKIFPVISMKMKRKILKAAAKNIRNPDRAAQFYDCCMKEKMTNTACTCLFYTTEAFKIGVLKSTKGPKELRNKNIVFIRLLVGKSFDILKAYLDYLNRPKDEIVRLFKNFYYSISKEKYLDIAETYVRNKFDTKFSEEIMKNHKDRVHAKPNFYINTVDTDILVKYSNIDDVKIYAQAILPETGSSFWSGEYYDEFRHIFEIIPEDKTYEFFKNYFLEHYPDTDFEMHFQFYNQNFFEFMTTEERQEWAFRHLQSQKQILGVGNDYKWYKFIKFEISFPALKDLINITTRPETRNSMTLALVDSAQNNRELETLFIYYYKRHVNELRSFRDDFLNHVIEHHNVFKFDKPCWAAFYEILLTLDPYNTSDTTDEHEKADENYKIITVLYHVLNDEPFPDELMKYLLQDFNVMTIDDHLDKVGQENYQKLHEFFFGVYMDNVAEYKRQAHGEDVRSKVERYFSNIVKSMALLNIDNGDNTKTEPYRQPRKTRSVDNSLSDRQLLRDLKKNKILVMLKIKDVKTAIHQYYSPFKLNNFLNKIKIYFPEDVTQLYLKMFEDLIIENKEIHTVKAGVHGILKIGDYDAKVDFIDKYAPISGKIDRKTIEVGHLRTQKAICLSACFSHPPLPLSSIFKYVKGSYAKICVRVFNVYLVTLPLPMCVEFVHLLIDAPISIQKHAIRLAFQCFSVENLIKVITDLWEKTKNVSMRSIIYKALFNKVVDTKKQLFMDVLLQFTSTLHQNDEKELFSIIVSNKLPDELLGDYIEAAWGAVSVFEDIDPYIKHKENIISCIRNKLHLLNKAFVAKIIEEHLNHMIGENYLEIDYKESDLHELYVGKWKLLARYVMYYTRSINRLDEYVDIIRRVVQNSIDNWEETDDDFIYQKFLRDFYDYLSEASYKHNIKHFVDALPIFEEFLSLVKSSLPVHDAFELTWDLELDVISRKTIRDRKNSDEEDDAYNLMLETIKDFSQSVGKLVSLYATNGTYAMTYSSDIKKMVKNHASKISHVVYRRSINFDNVLLTLACDIVQFDTPETCLLAIQLLSTNSDDEDDFEFVIDTAKKCTHPDVRVALFSKFREHCVKENDDDHTEDVNDNDDNEQAYHRRCMLL